MIVTMQDVLPAHAQYGHRITIAEYSTVYSIKNSSEDIKCIIIL